MRGYAMVVVVFAGLGVSGCVSTDGPAISVASPEIGSDESGSPSSNQSGDGFSASQWFGGFLSGPKVEETEIVHLPEHHGRGDDTPEEGACYRKVYVPARYEIEQKGRLVRKETVDYEVRPDGTGTHWDLVRNPGLYVERRRLIQKDYFTLHRVPCE